MILLCFLSLGGRREEDRKGIGKDEDCLDRVGYGYNLILICFLWIKITDFWVFIWKAKMWLGKGCLREDFLRFFKRDGWQAYFFKKC